jgi:hypothetical protein
MDSALMRLAGIYNSRGKTAALAFAGTRSIDVSNNSVRIVLEMAVPAESLLPSQSPQTTTNDSDNSRRNYGLHQIALNIKRKIRHLGGVVERAYGPAIRCRVPIETLETLCQDPLIRSIRQPIPLHSDVQSEGVSHSGAFICTD